MELREWAISILSATTLQEKLFCPEHLTDFAPGEPLIWDLPSRPATMGFRRHTREEKLPPLHELHKIDKRAICLHRFTGHELLAVEIMAFALLSFPYAPKYFRKGLANTLREEQGHVKIYQQRLNEMGMAFGDLPLYRHFWAYTPFMKTPAQYVSIMSLTFEMANLDFAPMYGKTFARYGDEDSAQLMQQIFQDELSHVAFGWQWLRKYYPEETDLWALWKQQLPPRMLPKRAKGFIYFGDHRRQAGLPEEWVINLQKA